MTYTHNSSKSFKKGYEKIAARREDARKEYWAFLDDLKKALGVRSLQAVYLYINGKTELRMSQVEPIRKVFAKYGVVGGIFD